MTRRYAADSIDEYFAMIPADQAAALVIVRDRLLALVPDAGEKIYYHIPSITYQGKPFVALSAAENHCSLHIMSPGVARELQAEVTEGTLSGATLQFQADAPLSDATLRLIVSHRMTEVGNR